MMRRCLVSVCASDAVLLRVRTSYKVSVMIVCIFAGVYARVLDINVQSFMCAFLRRMDQHTYVYSQAVITQTQRQFANLVCNLLLFHPLWTGLCRLCTVTVGLGLAALNVISCLILAQTILFTRYMRQSLSRRLWDCWRPSLYNYQSLRTRCFEWV